MATSHSNVIGQSVARIATVCNFPTSDLADDITAEDDEINEVIAVHLVKSLFLFFGAQSVLDINYRSSVA